MRAVMAACLVLGVAPLRARGLKLTRQIEAQRGKWSRLYGRVD